MAAQCGEGKEGYCNEIINDYFYYIRAQIVDQGPTALIMAERQNKEKLPHSRGLSLVSKLTDFVLPSQTFWLLTALTWRKYTDTSADVGKG